MIQGRIMGLLTLILTSVIGLGSANAEEHQSVKGEFVVVLKKNNFGIQNFNQINLKSMFQAESVKPISNLSGAVLVKKNMLETSEAAMSSLSDNSMVEYVEPNYIYTIDEFTAPDDPEFGQLWGLANDGKLGGLSGFDIRALEAWNITLGSRDVVVGVIDTGIDYTHPDLKDNIWVNEAELNGEAGVDDDENGFVDDIHGYDFANNDGDPLDDHYHGTHVAGTIGASGNNNVGVVGVNWNVRIMGLKFLTASGSGTLAGAIQAIDYATQMGVTLTNNSWGGGPFTQSLYAAIERAQEKGILFVAAAGNSSQNMELNNSYPAGYDLDNIISVAAVDRSANMADFSNYGANNVDIGAPGVEIYSTATNGEYKTLRGTSMASPHVAGVAALVHGYMPELTALEVKERILATATPIASLDGMTVTGGFLNAYGALSGEIPPPDMNNPKNWDKVDVLVETDHPYVENSVQEWVVEQLGAKEIALYFELFDTESGYDFLEIYDAAGNLVAKMSGSHTGRYSAIIPGSSARIVFISDRSVNKQGITISKLAYR